MENTYGEEDIELEANGLDDGTASEPEDPHPWLNKRILAAVFHVCEQPVRADRYSHSSSSLSNFISEILDLNEDKTYKYNE